MPYVKTAKPDLILSPNLLAIKANTTFGQTLSKIQKAANLDFVYVRRPIIHQMAAVLLKRLTGKKFIWIQGFSNPPRPNFFSTLFLAQADRILAKSQKEITKLKDLGIKFDKIKLQK